MAEVIGVSLPSEVETRLELAQLAPGTKRTCTPKPELEMAYMVVLRPEEASGST
ncbi:hypothetical protein D3C78_1572620 [compost metagenome]